MLYQQDLADLIDRLAIPVAIVVAIVGITALALILAH